MRIPWPLPGWNRTRLETDRFGQRARVQFLFMGFYACPDPFCVPRWHRWRWVARLHGWLHHLSVRRGL